MCVLILKMCLYIYIAAVFEVCKGIASSTCAGFKRRPGNPVCGCKQEVLMMSTARKLSYLLDCMYLVLSCFYFETRSGVTGCDMSSDVRFILLHVDSCSCHISVQM